MRELTKQEFTEMCKKGNLEADTERLWNIVIVRRRGW
jgi:hypothetical protein